MLRLFLKTNEYAQISLLKQLLKHKSIQKNSLKDWYQLNGVTFSRYIRTINQDLIELFPEKKVSLVTNPSNELTVVYPPSVNVDSILNTLIHFYLSSSSTYHILKLLLKRKKYPADLFLTEINVSQSYFNKLIKQINHFLAPCSIKVCQRNKEVFFDGPLTHVIFFEFLLLNNLTSISARCDRLGKFSDHPECHTDAFKQDPGLTCLTMTLEKYATELQHLRLVDQDVRELVTSLNQFHKNDSPIFKTHLEHASKDARLFINLLIHNSDNPANNFPSDQERIGAMLLESSNTISQDMRFLISDLTQRYLPNSYFSQRQTHRAMYFFTSSLTFLRIFKFNFKSLFKFVDTPFSDYQRLEEKLYLDIKDYFNTPENLAPLSEPTQLVLSENRQVFVDTSYTTIRSTFDPILNIYLNFNYQLTVEFFVRRRLLSIYNDNNVKFVTSPLTADLIITDYMSDRLDNTELFIFSDTNSIRELTELLQLIATLMMNKISRFTGAPIDSSQKN